MQIVKIEWVDSKGSQLWEHLDGLEPLLPVEVQSAGYLIDDNKDYKTIALGVSETQVLGRTTIPRGCIKKITVLGDG